MSSQRSVARCEQRPAIERVFPKSWLFSIALGARHLGRRLRLEKDYLLAGSRALGVMNLDVLRGCCCSWRVQVRSAQHMPATVLNWR